MLGPTKLAAGSGTNTSGFFIGPGKNHQESLMVAGIAPAYIREERFR